MITQRLVSESNQLCSSVDDPEVSISALSVASVADTPRETQFLPNGELGPYQLLERVGAGGMGEVWLAEQSYPVRRRVAIKLIKAGMDTSEVVKRFQSERQALALMDHPGIAKVFEAGSTPLGRPYFVMEYITGTPITQYCDQHKLTVRQRLDLFIQVCDAVQHAHQKAIIHRDLKPSNILVSHVDGKPLPRIIDFGLAKAISTGWNAETQFTQTGVMLGTPAYMSPEQAWSTDVDTRTDVYSLGVVLYELLVGVRPLDLHKLAFDQVLKTLREEDSPRPSTKFRVLSAESGATAENRGADPVTLVRQLRGDLDAIALKALAKTRNHRYGSPSDLAADIARYLRHEPVLAVTPSTAYYARKFARRYQAALAGTAVFVLVLIAAATISIRQTIRATSEAAAAQAVNSFLQNDLLSQAGTYRQFQAFGKGDPELKVRTALDRAAARINGKFAQQPDVETAIRNTIGESYMDIGVGPEARKQFERVFELQRRTLNDADPKLLHTRYMLAVASSAEGKYSESVDLLRKLIPVQRRVLGPRNGDTVASMYGLAFVYREQGLYVKSEKLLSDVLKTTRELFGQEDVRTLACMDRLAEVYYRLGEYTQAETMGKEVLELRRRVFGSEKPDTTISMSDLGNVYAALGKFKMAEEIYAQTLDIRRRALGGEHPYVMAAMNNLARAYSDLGKFSQAEALDRQAFEIRRRVEGPEAPETLMSMENLATDLSDQGKYARAEDLFAQTLEIEYREMGMESRFTLNTLSDAVSMYQKEGKYAFAKAYAEKVLTATRRALGSDSAVTMTTAADLAVADISKGDFGDGETLAREAWTYYRKSQPDDWQGARAESLLGASLAGQQKYTEAEPLLLEGYQGMVARKSRIAVTDWYNLDRARWWIVEFYRTWGRRDKLAQWTKTTSAQTQRARSLN